MRTLLVSLALLCGCAGPGFRSVSIRVVGGGRGVGAVVNSRLVVTVPHVLPLGSDVRVATQRRGADWIRARVVAAPVFCRHKPVEYWRHLKLEEPLYRGDSGSPVFAVGAVEEGLR